MYIALSIIYSQVWALQRDLITPGSQHSNSYGKHIKQGMAVDINSIHSLGPRPKPTPARIAFSIARGEGSCKLFSLNTISLVQRVENYLYHQTDN